MSGSIPSPWILEYLVDIAETYGGDLASVPPRPKAGRTQLIKYLTHPNLENVDATVWVWLSDKTHIIPARFSAEALKAYREIPATHGGALLAHRTAFLMIKKFRPFFARVPAGGSKGMTESEHLALHIDYFELKGAFDAEPWGKPQPVENDSRMQEWMNGLREPGGGGNVLKLRKLEQQRQNQDLVAQNDTAAPPNDPSLDKVESKKNMVRAARKTTGGKPPKQPPVCNAQPENIPDSKAGADPAREWKKKWRPYQANPKRFGLPPAEIRNMLWEIAPEQDCGQRKVSMQASKTRRNPLDMSSSPPTPEPEENRPATPQTADDVLPATPSQWSPSVRGSPRDSRNLDTIVEEDRDSEHSETRPNHPESFESVIQLERPSQRMSASQPPLVQPESLSQPTVTTQHESNSSYISAPTPAQRRRQPNSSSSPLFPLSSVPVPAVSTRVETNEVMAASHVVEGGNPSHQRGRRVPLPVFGQLSPNVDRSDPGRILVPNSDTSASMSQSQPYSQQSHESPSRDKVPVQLQHPQLSSDNSQAQDTGQSDSDSQRQVDNPQTGALTAQSLSYTSQPNSGSQSQRQPQTQAPTAQSLSYTSQSDSQGQSQGQSQHCCEIVPSLVFEDNPPMIGSYVRSLGEDAVNAVSPVVPSRSGSPVKPSPAKVHIDSQDSVVPTSQPEDIGDVSARVHVDLQEGELRDRHLASRNTVNAEIWLTTVPPTPSDPIDPVVAGSDNEEVRDDVDDGGVVREPHRNRPASEDPQPITDRKNTQVLALDSDDARTAATIANYVSRKRKSVSRSSSTSGSSSSDESFADIRAPVRHAKPLTRQVTSSTKSMNSDHPLPPSSPDVFLSEESFIASKSISTTKSWPTAESVATPPALIAAGNGRADTASSTVVDDQPFNQPTREKTSDHDPEAWKAPAFMLSKQKPTTEIKENTVPPSKAVPLRRKRVVSLTSSPEMPTKKPKTTEHQPQNTHVQLAQHKHTDTAVPTAAAHGTVPADAKTNTRQQTAVSISSAPRDLSTKRVTTAASRHVELNAHSTSTKQSNRNSTNRIPIPSRVTHRAGDQRVESSGVDRATMSESHPKPRANCPAGPAEAASRTEEAATTAAPRLLGGYRVGFEDVRMSTDAPLVSWNDLTDVLLRTGQGRYKAMKKDKKPR